MILAFFLYYLAFVNAVAFMAFWSDKRRAVTDRRRISEVLLLFLSLCGGWFGAKISQRLFRHKTRKQPFRLILDLVPVAWLAVVLVLLLVANMPDFTGFAQAKASDRATPKFFQNAKN